MKTNSMTKLFTILALAQNAHAALDAHEWGTFTALVGSDGITQNGMYHEDEKLPDFVHGFGEILREPRFSLLSEPSPTPTPIPTRCPRPSKSCFSDDVLNRNLITQKMETPVIYFYSDRARHVDVNVRFPEGVVTETFPAPVSTFPRQREGLVLANGNTTFSVDVLTEKNGPVPFVDAGNIYSHARNVASNLVRSGDELEKFIFYRGLGRFQPRLDITSKGGNLNIRGNPSAYTPAAFLVHVNESGEGQMIKLGNINFRQPKAVSARTISRLSDHRAGSDKSGILSGASAERALTQALVRTGLFQDEAQAMVDTWKHGYLQVPGLRLLYILPQEEVNGILPVQFSPEPDHFVRAFMGRMEILLDTEEKRILSDVLQQRDGFDPSTLGRFAEPILRRVAEVHEGNGAATPEEKALFHRLIGRAMYLPSDSSSLH